MVDFDFLLENKGDLVRPQSDGLMEVLQHQESLFDKGISVLFVF